jgi:hypothetical protein
MSRRLDIIAIEKLQGSDPMALKRHSDDTPDEPSRWPDFVRVLQDDHKHAALVTSEKLRGQKHPVDSTGGERSQQPRLLRQAGHSSEAIGQSLGRRHQAFKALPLQPEMGERSSNRIGDP